jgi:hypothetical protein
MRLRADYPETVRVPVQVALDRIFKAPTRPSRGFLFALGKIDPAMTAIGNGA